MEIWYRFHQEDAPTFTADNAWSGPWGSEWNENGSQYKCFDCDGTGQDWSGHWDDSGECHMCHGTGWRDCRRGYSSCTSPGELLAYFSGHAGGHPGPGAVIAFAGEQCDVGDDGEPLVVPTKVIETLTWDEFTARASA